MSCANLGVASVTHSNGICYVMEQPVNGTRLSQVEVMHPNHCTHKQRGQLAIIYDWALANWIYTFLIQPVRFSSIMAYAK